MKRKPQRKRRRSYLVTKRACYFCLNKLEPDYKEFEILERFISDRGKIVSRCKSGLCARHQRRLSSEIKKGRFLALLPFLTTTKRY